MHLEQCRQFIMEAFETLTPITAGLNGNERNLYSARLKELHKKFYDPEFRLAVVGNFSCGKSTFLNALLMKRLLTTDVLPTTAIPTYIRWNKETLLKQANRAELKYCNPIITLTMTDGKVYTLTKSGKVEFERETAIALPEDTGAIIDTLTTTNSLIGKITRVDLTFPERRGFVNFCLIDTPGVNPGAEESREHVLQTQKVLREDADAVILLYSAKDAMGRDTEEFMRDNGGHLMAGAIILLTKMDLVPARQVDKILKNTARLVKDRFGQEEPQIFPISAQQALDYFSGDNTDAKSSQVADDFNQTIKTIISQLSDRRSEIVSRRISDLMLELIESISKIVSSNLATLENERDLLKKASVENLEKDFDELNRAYERTLKKKVNDDLHTIKGNIQTIIADRREEIFRRINAATDANQVEDCLKNYYPTIMANVNEEIIRRLDDIVISSINESARDYAGEVAECLRRYERYLGSVSTQAVDMKSRSNLEISITAPEMKKSFLEDNLGKIGVAAFLLLGVAGLAILAGAYFFGGKSRLEAKKDKAKEDVAKDLREYEDKLFAACKSNITQVRKDILTWARNLLEKYRKSYQTLFDEIEKKHNERVNEIESQIVRNKGNINRIEDLRNFSATI